MIITIIAHPGLLYSLSGIKSEEWRGEGRVNGGI